MEAQEGAEILQNPLEDLSNKVRHTYDLTLLMKIDTLRDFVNSNLFHIMLLQVAKDDDKAIPNDKNWLYKHPKNALIFNETARVWDTLKKTYTGSKFKELIIGKSLPPYENEVLETLMFLSNRIEGIKWDVKE